MIDLILILVLALGLTSIISLLVTRKRQPRFLNCRFCRDGLLTSFERLPADLQAHLRAYFKNHERRRPNFQRLFHCPGCDVVFDEYSNATKALYTRSGGSLIKAGSHCKVCLAYIEDCALDRDNINCPRCQTQYRWRPYKDQSTRYLHPPDDIEIRPLGLFKRGQIG